MGLVHLVRGRGGQSKAEAATHTGELDECITRAMTRPAAPGAGRNGEGRALRGTATRTDSHGKLAAIIALSIVVYPLQPESEDDVGRVTPPRM